MSGLEIIGAVAGIFTLLQTSKEVVRRVIEARKENSEVPLAFRGLNQALQLVEHSLEDISTQASSNRIDQGLKRKLMRMIRVVRDQILELNGIFQRMIPDGNVSKLRSSWSAVISVGQDKKVQAILQKVVMYQNLLRNAMPAENCLSTKQPHAQTHGNQREMAQLINHNPFKTSTDGIFNGETTIYQTNNFSIPESQLVGFTKSPQELITNTVAGTRPNPQLTYVLDCNKLPGGETPTMQFEPTSSQDVDVNNKCSTLHSNGPLDGGSDTMKTIFEGSSPVDKVQAIKEANKSILTGTEKVNEGDYSVARESYQLAIKYLKPLATSDAALLVQKFRGLTAAAFGLTLVTKAEFREKFLQRAYSYNTEAYSQALRSLQARDLARVRLDTANLKARDARMCERQSKDHTGVNTLRSQSLDLFLEVVQELSGTCNSVESYDVLAQAFQGCGRMERELSSIRTFAGYGQRQPKHFADYFQAALSCISQALTLPNSADQSDSSRQRLLQTREEIYLSMERSGQVIR